MRCHHQYSSPFISVAPGQSENRQWKDELLPPSWRNHFGHKYRRRRLFFSSWGAILASFDCIFDLALGAIGLSL